MKSNYYKQMFDLAHFGGVAYKSKYTKGDFFVRDAMQLTIGPIGPMETRIMVKKATYAESGCVRHYASASNKNEPNVWRPLTLKKAKYILETLIEDKRNGN